MRTAVLAFILINIALSQATFLKKNTPAFNIFNKLQTFENSDFGKKILDTIALQLKNKSPLGDVAKMLADIRQDLILQDQDADQLHAEQENECDTEITEYIRRIDVASEQQEDAQAEIEQLQGEISGLEGEIAGKAAQLEILASREAALKQERENDHAEFESRQAQTVQVIEAVDLIVEKLGSITPEKSADAALAELAKIGSSNPILALVQVASTFTKEALDGVLQKLNDLRESLEAAMEEDRANEEQAVADYTAIMGEIETTRKSVSAAKAEAESQHTQKSGALALQQKLLADAVAELDAATNGKAAKETQCEEWRVTYARNKEARNKEIDIVKQVENIMATKLSTMKDYIDDRE